MPYLPLPRKHARTHLPGGSDPLPLGGAVIYEIKVDPDDTTAVTADDRHVFAIPSDLDGWSLTDAQAWVSTVGDDVAIVYIRNVTTTNDMLADPVTIDAGDFTSYTAGTPSSVEATYAEVSTGDLISVDVNVGVTPTCKGLGVILTFSPP